LFSTFIGSVTEPSGDPKIDIYRVSSFSVIQNIVMWSLGALYSSTSDRGFGIVGPALKSEVVFSLIRLFLTIIGLLLSLWGIVEAYGNPVNWFMLSILPNFTFGPMGNLPSILGDSKSLTSSAFLCFFLSSSLVLSVIYLQKETINKTSLNFRSMAISLI